MRPKQTVGVNEAAQICGLDPILLRHRAKHRAWNLRGWRRRPLRIRISDLLLARDPWPKVDKRRTMRFTSTDSPGGGDEELLPTDRHGRFLVDWQRSDIIDAPHGRSSLIC